MCVTVVLKWIPGKRLGLQTHLALNANEQSFVDSVSVYTSNWIRIELNSNQVYTDDHFRGKTLTVMIVILYCQAETIVKLKYDEFRSSHL